MRVFCAHCSEEIPLRWSQVGRTKEDGTLILDRFADDRPCVMLICPHCKEDYHVEEASDYVPEREPSLNEIIDGAYADILNQACELLHQKAARLEEAGEGVTAVLLETLAYAIWDLKDDQ